MTSNLGIEVPRPELKNTPEHKSIIKGLKTLYIDMIPEVMKRMC